MPGIERFRRFETGDVDFLGNLRDAVFTAPRGAAI
jgi:hypothetical protein